MTARNTRRKSALVIPVNVKVFVRTLADGTASKYFYDPKKGYWHENDPGLIFKIRKADGGFATPDEHSDALSKSTVLIDLIGLMASEARQDHEAKQTALAEARLTPEQRARRAELIARDAADLAQRTKQEIADAERREQFALNENLRTKIADQGQVLIRTQRSREHLLGTVINRTARGTLNVTVTDSVEYGWREGSGHYVRRVDELSKPIVIEIEPDQIIERGAP